MANPPESKKQLADYNSRELLGHKRTVYTLGWSSSGRKLASGSYDASVRIWSVEPFCGSKPERSDTELKGHTGAVTHVAWKPGSDSVVASATSGKDADKSLKVWDAKSGKCTATVPTSSGCMRVTWSPDASSLAILCSDNTVSVVDVRKARVFKSTRFTHGVNDIHWGPTNQQLMVCTDHGSVDVVGMPHLEMTLWSLRGHTGAVYCMAPSKGYKYLASGGGDAQISLWDLEGMVVVRTWAHMDAPVHALGMSADGSLLAYATEGGEMEVLATHTGERLHEFRLRTNRCDCVAWNPVHPVLAYADEFMDTGAPRSEHRPPLVGTVNIYAPPKPA